MLKNNKGYTLVEIIVVVVIIAIVSVTATISVTNAVKAHRNKAILKSTADTLNSDRYTAFVNKDSQTVSKLILIDKVYHVKTYKGDEEVRDVKVGNSKNLLSFAIVDDETLESLEDSRVLIEEMDFVFDKANGQFKKVILNGDELHLYYTAFLENDNDTNVVEINGKEFSIEKDASLSYTILVNGKENHERMTLAPITGRVIYETYYKSYIILNLF